MITREQAVAYRLHVNHLVDRLPAGSHEQAAYVGLQDTAPRDALLGLHARMAGCAPSDGAGPDASGVRSSVSGEAAARSMETTEGEDMRGFLDARIPPKPATRIACAQDDPRARALSETRLVPI